MVADWHKSLFGQLIKEVPEDKIVLHMDFAENYATFNENEISSAYWMKNLITVHPIVAYYNCAACTDDHPVMDVPVFFK